MGQAPAISAGGLYCWGDRSATRVVDRLRQTVTLVECGGACPAGGPAPPDATGASAGGLGRLFGRLAATLIAARVRCTRGAEQCEQAGKRNGCRVLPKLGHDCLLLRALTPGHGALPRAPAPITVVEYPLQRSEHATPSDNATRSGQCFLPDRTPSRDAAAHIGDHLFPDLGATLPTSKAGCIAHAPHRGPVVRLLRAREG